MGFHFFASLVERCLRLLTNNVKLVKVPDINYSQQIMCTNVRLLSESTADEYLKCNGIKKLVQKCLIRFDT